MGILSCLAAGCSRPSEPPQVQEDAEAGAPAVEWVPAPDAAATTAAQYDDLARQASEQMRSYDPSTGAPDPRPFWATALEAFALSHRGTPEAGKALVGVMQLHEAMQDPRGFFEAWNLMLQEAPDAPELSGVFAMVSSMRMVEAGGAGIMSSPDQRERRIAFRRAAPRIVADMEKAIAATGTGSTKAAAHYTIGSTYYEYETNPAEALRQFGIVAQQYPQWSLAESAAEHTQELTHLVVGRPAPDFTTVASDGTTLKLSDLKGKIVLLNFWAIWCPACVDEIPSLRLAWERYRARGFTIVGVNLDTGADAPRDFMTRNKVAWRNITSGLAMQDPIARMYHVQILPMSYLVDRSGIIRARGVSGQEAGRLVGELLGR